MDLFKLWTYLNENLWEGSQPPREISLNFDGDFNSLCGFGTRNMNFIKSVIAGELLAD